MDTQGSGIKPYPYLLTTISQAMVGTMQLIMECKMTTQSEILITYKVFFN